MTEYPRLTDEQLVELEKRLIAAEQEIAIAYNRNTLNEKGPATIDLEFKSAEYARRLLEDVKAYRRG